MDAAAPRRMSWQRTAKPCGPGAAMLASSSWEASFLGATVARKPVHRGERGVSRKTIAQGRPECFPLNLYARVRLFCDCACARDRGCSAHPAFPAPSCFSGGSHRRKARAPRGPRERESLSARCSTVESDPRPAASTSSPDEPAGRAFATRWLIRTSLACRSAHAAFAAVSGGAVSIARM